MSSAAWIEVKETFAEAAGWFVATTAEVHSSWQDSALGEWTVRDLAGHTSRALLTVESYLDRLADVEDVASPVEYFWHFRSTDDPAVGSAAVAERGRAAGRALGPEAAAEVAAIAERVLGRVEAADGEELVTTPFGGMRLVNYLPTRTFELIVHTCDLAAALGRSIEVPEKAARESLDLVGGLAARGGRAAPLLRAATGRSGLPDGFTVL
jgi:hypothetical protein